jgi:NAD(P)H dehydrogenase (quinone)
VRVHLVHAHPEPASFVAAMRDTMAAAFQAGGAEVTVSDLYAMDFEAVASAADFGTRQNSEHLFYALEQRHGRASGTIAADIAAEVDRVLAADLLAFTFPVFWFSTPAILKGWIDRVFLSGTFYGGKRVYGRGGLAGKRAAVAMSLGGREHMFGQNAIHGELVTGMMRHFFQGTLGYVGLAVHAPFVAYHVPYVDDAARRDMLAHLDAYVRSLDRQPVLAMPDLARFDDTFAPRDKG